jgi:glyoxylase-like metal-dependent hydrolase (beta-lactamase superfamily II)
VIRIYPIETPGHKKDHLSYGLSLIDLNKTDFENIITKDLFAGDAILGTPSVF